MVITATPPEMHSPQGAGFDRHCRGIGPEREVTLLKAIEGILSFENHQFGVFLAAGLQSKGA